MCRLAEQARQGKSWFGSVKRRPKWCPTCCRREMFPYLTRNRDGCVPNYSAFHSPQFHDHAQDHSVIPITTINQLSAESASTRSDGISAQVPHCFQLADVESAQGLGPRFPGCSKSTSLCHNHLVDETFPAKHQAITKIAHPATQQFPAAQLAFIASFSSGAFPAWAKP